MAVLGLFTKDEMLSRIATARAHGQILPDYDLAIVIGMNGLIGQTDKAGNAYGHHLIEVSRHNTNSEPTMIAGFLHDLIEDTKNMGAFEWTFEDLRTAGFSDKVVDAVDGVTHREDEKYFDSIERCSLNRRSIDIKLSDNRHNCDWTRNDFLAQSKDTERVNKYIITREYLVAVKTEEIVPGTPLPEFIKLRPKYGHDLAFLAKYSSHYASPAVGSKPTMPIPS